jgi:hypothetical protein
VLTHSLILQNDKLRITYSAKNKLNKSKKTYRGFDFANKFCNKFFLITQEEQTTQAPVFTSSMKTIEVKEGQRAHFECKIIPVSDPTLKVEWFHNGQPLKQGK